MYITRAFYGFPPLSSRNPHIAHLFTHLLFCLLSGHTPLSFSVANSFISAHLVSFVLVLVPWMHYIGSLGVSSSMALIFSHNSHICAGSSEGGFSTHHMLSLYSLAAIKYSLSHNVSISTLDLLGLRPSILGYTYVIRDFSAVLAGHRISFPSLSG